MQLEPNNSKSDSRGEVTEHREIYCCGCQAAIQARLTNGAEIYPHREDLHALPFWICDGCKNYVSCHHKTATPTEPLGNIPTKEIRNARNHIHRILDPIWENAEDRKQARKKIYAKLSRALGYQYHTGEIKTLEQAREIYKIVKEIAA